MRVHFELCATNTCSLNSSETQSSAGHNAEPETGKCYKNTAVSVSSCSLLLSSVLDSSPFYATGRPAVFSRRLRVLYNTAGQTRRSWRVPPHCWALSAGQFQDCKH